MNAPIIVTPETDLNCQGVYLIHMDDKLTLGAQHYIGWSTNMAARTKSHRNGTSRSRFMAEVRRRGINWRVVKVWKGEDYNLEHKLKHNGHYDKLCPTCRTNNKTGGNNNNGN